MNTFTVDNLLLINSKQIYLNLNGVDTVAEVYVNNHLVGRTKNMFVKYRFDIKSRLKVGDNRLSVKIFSPIVYAKNEAKQFAFAYNYTIPPNSNPDDYNGENHVNFLRKMQASFAWDWGPAFPSLGIWKSVNLEVIRSVPIMRDFTAVTFQNSNKWIIKATLDIGMPDPDNYRAYLRVDLADEKLYEDYIEVGGSFNVKLRLENVKINFTPNLWWPNGLIRTASGQSSNATLYNLTVTWKPQGCEDDNDCSSLSKKVGFRNIDLIQERLSNALSFRVEVNGHSTFVRGTNIIPISVFPEVSPENYIRHLLKSVKRANMNMVRVWGGGIYMSDLFYDLADEMGIMIWQDFMFACALYPATKSFLENVQVEITQQVERLQHHPSMAIWAGNNENEAAFAQKWWPEIRIYSKIYKNDYLNLYFNTIAPIMNSSNPHATYLSSSPSNGLITILEGGISTNPGDFRFGDVHYYDYYKDVWNWTNYPSAKFVSEYGIQSYPSIGTLRTALPADKLTWPLSDQLRHRQHHPRGDNEIKMLIQQHMNLTQQRNPQKQFAKYVYLSQILQAVAIKSQTEFYIRNRFLDKTTGHGLTYGAMYWQLNDVWQAPTWSSIEYGGKWKMLHYYMIKVFQPANAFAWIDDKLLNIALINDYLNPVSIHVTVSMQRYADLLPITILDKNFKEASKGVSIIYIDSLDEVLSKGGCLSIDHCMIKLQINHMIDGKPETGKQFDSFTLLSSPKNIIGLLDPAIRIEKVKLIKSTPSRKFQIDLKSDHLAMFVWVDTDSSIPIKAIFSDNGFMMVDKRKSIYMETLSNITTQELAKVLKVTHLLDEM